MFDYELMKNNLLDRNESHAFFSSSTMTLPYLTENKGQSNVEMALPYKLTNYHKQVQMRIEELRRDWNLLEEFQFSYMVLFSV
jgi:hypothetical protein